MTNPSSIVFSDRPVVILELPLSPRARLLHPDQVMLKINGRMHDIGAFCYSLRSNEMRMQGKPCKVVLSSFRNERVNQIFQVIKVFSIFLKDGGKRPYTVVNHLRTFKVFMDWADTNGCSDCLAGGDATRSAYRLFSRDVEDRLQRHEFESSYGLNLQSNVLTVLEVLTGVSDLGKGIRFIRNMKNNGGGTAPATEHDFAHALALNDSIFQGLCDLILGNQPFPFKLPLTKSLGWPNDFLWLFPTNRWFLPPHQWGEARMKLASASWPHDYEQGRLATADEIWHQYSGPDSLKQRKAVKSITMATTSMETANRDSRDYFRRMLAMVAHNAFYFLFLSNSGANAASVKDIETDGEMEESTSNPGYRAIKWRAQEKVVSVIVPIAFVPSLRRYMELRKYLLNGKEFPYLFLSLGRSKRDDVRQNGVECLYRQYKMLRRIAPQLPCMGAHKIRATVLAYYRQKHDAAISAAVGQHTQKTSDRHYDAGTEAGQLVELSLLMEKIAQKAQQQIVAKDAVIIDGRSLEEGGVCHSYGQAEPLTEGVPVKPNCKTGCIFCSKRVLIAGEEDTRKVASAAFLMGQLILGPMSEVEFRPQIAKCDEDLAKIRAFEGCAEMVDRVKKDVYENGNLTPYFADKFQLFLTLGVL